MNALRVACAPHYPAEARALVGSDVLAVLSKPKGANGSGELVRQFFAVTDASKFSLSPEANRALLSLEPKIERLLDELEDRL